MSGLELILVGAAALIGLAWAASRSANRPGRRDNSGGEGSYSTTGSDSDCGAGDGGGGGD